MTDTNSLATYKERYLWELYLLIGSIIVLVALVMLGNLPRMSAWLLMLLAIGVGQAFIFPATISFLGGLVAVVFWVSVRQVTGIWTLVAMPQNLLEIAGLSLNIILAIRFRKVWQDQQDELKELRALKEIMVSDDVGAGLLPLSVAQLRLLEEIDRARQFHRPLGLLAVEISPLAEEARDAKEYEHIFTAVARQISSASLVQDIPFRQSATQIGMILPERTWEDLYKDADLIASSLSEAIYIDRDERPKLIRDHIKLSFGLGTYQGESIGEIDLVQAADDSLRISRDLADLGETSISAYAMPATPIVESKQILTDMEN